MKNQRVWIAAVSTVLFAVITARAEVKIVTDHNDGSRAGSDFKFRNVPSPSRNDLGAKAKFSIVAGTRDAAGAELERLNDGRLPRQEDQPAESFFFAVGTDGGRLQADLGSAIAVNQINTYSWHPGARGPQVYKLYASEGMAAGFDARPGRGTDPETCGWKLIASVNTRPKEGEAGGQYGASISADNGPIGNYRYLLFDISRTGADESFDNTFYSEIDIVSGDTVEVARTDAAAAPEPFRIKSADGKCDITIDTSGATDLKEWAETKLAPVLAEWFPKIVAMLPSEGYTPPTSFSVTIRPGNGVASASGTRITANANWLRRELDGEALGALLHEEVHVIQLYGRRGSRGEPGRRLPGWLVEGIPDYIRWFLYEPQSHGADDVWMRRQNFSRVRYDASYRQSANFLNWVTEKYDKDIVAKLNAAARAGKYSDEIWQEKSGKTAQELGDEWKAQLAKKLDIEWTPAANSNTNASAPAAGSNTITNR